MGFHGKFVRILRSFCAGYAIIEQQTAALLRLAVTSASWSTEITAADEQAEYCLYGEKRQLLCALQNFLCVTANVSLQ